MRQIVSRAVASEGVVDIFAAAGLQKPDISILSDQFLADVRGMPQRNLAVELLRKLLSGETHEVLKNFPTANELANAVRPFASEAHLEDLHYYWLLVFKLK